jgi:hypothetical protein
MGEPPFFKVHEVWGAHIPTDEGPAQTTYRQGCTFVVVLLETGKSFSRSVRVTLHYTTLSS